MIFHPIIELIIVFGFSILLIVHCVINYLMPEPKFERTPCNKDKSHLRSRVWRAGKTVSDCLREPPPKDRIGRVYTPTHEFMHYLRLRIKEGNE